MDAFWKERNFTINRFFLDCVEWRMSDACVVCSLVG